MIERGNVHVRRIMTVTVATSALLAACGGGGSKSAGDASSNRSGGKPAPLAILVTNDDGYAAPGIDMAVEALRTLPAVKVTVVAPATNKSGTGSQVTASTLTAHPQETLSGYPATAVDGFPADTVTYATSQLGLQPDLVVSGINFGQNLGAITAVSGTVGAAKVAAARGIPAIAVSQGLGSPPDYPSAAKLVVQWITSHRASLTGKVKRPVGVLNLNVPTCWPGTKIRGIKQVPLAASSAGAVDHADCASTTTSFADDIAAFLAGYSTITELTAAGANVTTTTTWKPTS